MRTFDEFQRFAGTDLFPALQLLENEREILKKRYLVPEILIWIGFACIVAVMFFVGKLWWIVGICALACLVYGIIHSTQAAKEKRTFRSRYKDRVIAPIIAFIDPGLHFLPHDYIPEHLFIESSLFMRTPDRYKGEDLVEGMVGKTNLAFSELHAEYKTEHYDSKGRRRTQWHTLFKGIFFIADFNKHFTGRTIVLPDSAEKAFGSLIGNFFQKMNFTRGKLIKLENVAFEKEFAVYGDDQIESRYILTPELMERLLDFKKKTKTQLHISFIASRMFVGLSTMENYFEPAYFRSVVDRDMINKYFTILALVIGMVEDFNLNTRIWGKE